MQVQQITKDVLLEKYAKGNEQSAEDIFKRVAKGIAAVEQNKHVEREFEIDGVIVKKAVHEHDYWEGVFYNNMMNGAIGAGRIMSAAGAGIAATLANCKGDTPNSPCPILKEIIVESATIAEGIFYILNIVVILIFK